MKISVAFALLAMLICGRSEGARADGSGNTDQSRADATAEGIQQAVNLSRRGQYQDALQSYQLLLFTEPIASDIELRGYLLSQAVSRFGREHPARSILLNAAAAVYVAEKKYEQAEPLVLEAAELGRRRFPTGHPMLVGVLQNYSYVLTKLNRQESASRSRAESETLLAFPRP